MPIKPCKNCKTDMVYNNHYHCYECHNCGKTYNGAMQELRPIEDWKDEYDNEDY